jgi:hypothetical protein
MFCSECKSNALGGSWFHLAGLLAVREAKAVVRLQPIGEKIRLARKSDIVLDAALLRISAQARLRVAVAADKSLLDNIPLGLVRSRRTAADKLRKMFSTAPSP